ncbi:MAG: LysM peptidoglycan-binding domain-containing protein [Anaerovorax sp.]
MTKNDAGTSWPTPPTCVIPTTCAHIHTVIAGDTLYTLSYKYHVSVPVLMQVNKILNPYNLRVGQKICIPSRDPNGPAPVCKGAYYKVMTGDTLYMIAKKYKITLDALITANPTLDPYNLGVGMTLCIPGTGVLDATGDDNIFVKPETPPVKPENPEMPNPKPELPSTPGNGGNHMDCSCPGGMVYHTQKGDTLARVLDRFGVTYEALKKANPTVDFCGSLETMVLCIPMEQ